MYGWVELVGMLFEIGFYLKIGMALFYEMGIVWVISHGFLEGLEIGPGKRILQWRV